MAETRARALIEELARTIELEGLELDEDGTVSLQLDEVVVTLTATEDDGTIALFSALRGTEGEKPRELLEAALTANFAQLADELPVLALEPQSGALVLFRRVPLEGLDYPAFEAALGSFTDAVEAWAAKAAGYLTAPEAELPARRGDAEFLDPGMRA